MTSVFRSACRGRWARHVAHPALHVQLAHRLEEGVSRARCPGRRGARERRGEAKASRRTRRGLAQLLDAGAVSTTLHVTASWLVVPSRPMDTISRSCTVMPCAVRTVRRMADISPVSCAASGSSTTCEPAKYVSFSANWPRESSCALGENGGGGGDGLGGGDGGAGGGGSGGGGVAGGVGRRRRGRRGRRVAAGGGGAWSGRWWGGVLVRRRRWRRLGGGGVGGGGGETGLGGGGVGGGGEGEGGPRRGRRWAWGGGWAAAGGGTAGEAARARRGRMGRRRRRRWRAGEAVHHHVAEERALAQLEDRVVLRLPCIVDVGARPTGPHSPRDARNRIGR